MTDGVLEDLPITGRLDPGAVARIGERLGRFVYLLIDPRDARPFYVGRGVGTRMLAHGEEAEDTDLHGPKVERIRAIRAKGFEPEIWIVRYGLTAPEYTAVEAALIDVLMSFRITPEASGRPVPLARRNELVNARREDATGKGLIALDRLVDELAAPELVTEEPLLLITLTPWVDLPERVAGDRTRSGYGFRTEWIDPIIRTAALDELELSLTAWWSLQPANVERAGIRHVIPVFRGVTRGLFEIERGSWTVEGGKAACVAHAVRSGDLWDQVVGPHGHRVPGRERGSQNAVLYWPRRRPS